MREVKIGLRPDTTENGDSYVRNKRIIFKKWKFVRDGEALTLTQKVKNKTMKENQWLINHLYKTLTRESAKWVHQVTD